MIWLLRFFGWVGGLLGWLRDRRLRKEGARKEKRVSQERALEDVRKSNQARERSRDDAESQRLRNKFERRE